MLVKQNVKSLLAMAYYEELPVDLTASLRDRFLSSAGAGGNCARPMGLPDPSPVLDKNRAPMGPEILSSTGRKAPMAFPDSSSVLDKFQSATHSGPKNHDSQRRDRILRPFSPPGNRAIFSTFGGDFLLSYTENLEKKLKNPLEKLQKIQWRRRPEIADFSPLLWSNAS